MLKPTVHSTQPLYHNMQHIEPTEVLFVLPIPFARNWSRRRRTLWQRSSRHWSRWRLQMSAQSSWMQKHCWKHKPVLIINAASELYQAVVMNTLPLTHEPKCKLCFLNQLRKLSGIWDRGRSLGWRLECITSPACHGDGHSSGGKVALHSSNDYAS